MLCRVDEYVLGQFAGKETGEDDGAFYTPPFSGLPGGETARFVLTAADGTMGREADLGETMGIAIETTVLDFVQGAYGKDMDVDAMAALVSEDFEWRLNVPLSPIIRCRDAALAELQKHNQLSSGMIEGSRIVTVVSNDTTVVIERIDVNDVGGQELTFHVTA